MTEFIITSTMIILIVLILRVALRNHVSHCCIYALWLMVVLRLAIPVTFIHSPLSVLNYINRETLTGLSDTSPAPKSDFDNTLTDTDLPGQSEPAFDMPENNFVPAAYNPANEERNAPENIPSVTDRAFPFKTFLLSVWILGCVILGSFFTAVNFRFHHKLVRSRRLLEQYTTEKINVYLVEDLNSPCIFGLFRPAVYLNAKALENPKNTEYVLAHELCHLRHGDLFWSFVRCLLTVLYWFHPLVWCAAILSKRDCEYACDESVLLQYERTSSAGKEFHAIRTEYGSALLSLIPQKTFSSFGIASTSMTSRKKLLKLRIRYIAQKPETRLAAVIVLIAASLLAIGCTLTSPDNNGSTDTDETPTEPISENQTSDGDFPEMAKHPGDVIYTAPFSGKTLQVVMTEA
ncbi:MAG: M56 family metallopeptidase, partial [Alistipes sp.]|nr:M56 family metallopeptidase [Alistipes sp.]